MSELGNSTTPTSETPQSSDFLDTALVPDWLDDIDGANALAWATTESAATQKWVDTAATDQRAADGSPTNAREQLAREIRNILDTPAKIAYPTRRGELLYNYWTDAEHPRGQWRRTTLAEFKKDSPDWEIILDLDALAEAEGENWVWKGSVCRYPAYDRAFVLLSRGGADATVVREFDLETCQFVPEDEAFYLPEAKSDVSWIDRDNILIGTDFGAGSLTDSGYPRQVRRWHRGDNIEDSEVIFAGHTTDVAVGGWFDATEGFHRLFVERAQDFYTSQRFIAMDRPGKLASQSGGGFSLQIIEVPDDCRITVHHEWLVLLPRTAFGNLPAGSLGVAKLDEWLAGNREVEVLFTPSEHTSLQTLAWTKNYLIISLLDDVATKLVCHRIGGWEKVNAFEALPHQATLSVIGTSAERDDEVWLTSSSALDPVTLWHGRITTKSSFSPIKRAPAFFDTTGMSTRQHWATSADGTKIPYRITGNFTDNEVTDAETLSTQPPDLASRHNDEQAPRKAPTLLYAYGGFEVSLVPGYSGLRGLAWLSKGNYFVEANLRGGGEFGPQWHSAVVKTERMRVYEDHQTVLKDLVERGYCDRDHLAVRGGSNGGLLSAVCLTLYPELVGAVVSQVPLADMMRYHTLSAGASWMAEYGNPDDPTERAAIAEYSPVQRVAKREDRQYPPALVTTSTRDDRVHPAHARSLAWLLKEAGQDVDYYENTEGGHAGAADNAQVAFVESLIYQWLIERIGSAEKEDK